MNEILDIVFSLCEHITAFNNRLPKSQDINKLKELKAFFSKRQETSYEYTCDIEEVRNDLIKMTQFAKPECFEITDKVSQVMSATDIHGDFFSFVNVIINFIELLETDSDAFLIFTGDYLDRGSDEMLCLMLIAKLINANFKNILFTRGNHDTDDFASQKTGMKNENDKCLMSVNNLLSKVFRAMPYVILATVNNKRIAFVHAALPLKELKFSSKECNEAYTNLILSTSSSRNLTRDTCEVSYESFMDVIKSYTENQYKDDDLYMPKQFITNFMFTSSNLIDDSEVSKELYEAFKEFFNETIKTVTLNKEAWDEFFKDTTKLENVPYAKINTIYDIDSVKQFIKLVNEVFNETVKEMSDKTLKETLNEKHKKELIKDFEERSNSLIKKIEERKPRELNRKQCISYFKAYNSEEFKAISKQVEEEIQKCKDSFNFEEETKKLIKPKQEENEKIKQMYDEKLNQLEAEFNKAEARENQKFEAQLSKAEDKEKLTKSHNYELKKLKQKYEKMKMLIQEMMKNGEQKRENSTFGIPHYKVINKVKSDEEIEKEAKRSVKSNLEYKIREIKNKFNVTKCLYDFNIDDYITFSEAERHIATWTDIDCFAKDELTVSKDDRCFYGLEQIHKSLEMNHIDILVRGHQASILSFYKKAICTHLEDAIENSTEYERLRKASQYDAARDFCTRIEQENSNSYSTMFEDDKNDKVFKIKNYENSVIADYEKKKKTLLEIEDLEKQFATSKETYIKYKISDHKETLEIIDARVKSNKEDFISNIKEVEKYKKWMPFEISFENSQHYIITSHATSLSAGSYVIVSDKSCKAFDLN